MVQHVQLNQGAHGKNKKNAEQKRVVKYLAVCRDPQIQRLILQKSSDGVIKSISNAMLNAQQGDIHWSAAMKRKLRPHRKFISMMSSRGVPIAKKRRLLTSQRGGFLPLLGPIIGTVLGAVGPSLLGGLFGNR